MKYIILIISISLFIFALTKKCYTTDFYGTSDNSVPSIMALLTGWLGVIGMQAPAISWLANPALVLSWIAFFNNSKYALLISIATLLLMLSFSLFKKIVVTEAGHYANIITYELGYYMWMASAVVVIVGNIFVRYS